VLAERVSDKCKERAVHMEKGSQRGDRGRVNVWAGGELAKCVRPCLRYSSLPTNVEKCASSVRAVYESEKSGPCARCDGSQSSPTLTNGQQVRVRARSRVTNIRPLF